MLTDLLNSFTITLASKLVVTSYLPHLKCVASLPREIAFLTNSILFEPPCTVYMYITGNTHRRTMRILWTLVVRHAKAYAPARAETNYITLMNDNWNDEIIRLQLMLTHYRNKCLTALCPGLPRWAGTRKVKPIWILLKQETASGSGISWAQRRLRHINDGANAPWKK